MRSAIILGAALVGAAGWVAYDSEGRFLSGDNREHPAGGNFSCTVASITDGDTLRCHETGPDGRQIRVRLSGISARERDGSCSPGHPCPDASADAATAELVRLAAGRELRCEAVGTTYGRVAAFCSAGGVDLSCAMVASGTAARWDRYWGGHRCR